MNPEVPPSRWPPPPPRPGELAEAGGHFAATCVGVALLILVVWGVMTVTVVGLSMLAPPPQAACAPQPSDAVCRRLR